MGRNTGSGPANPQDLNRYAYALNNPPTYTDPTGHLLLPVLLVGELALKAIDDGWTAWDTTNPALYLHLQIGTCPTDTILPLYTSLISGTTRDSTNNVDTRQTLDCVRDCRLKRQRDQSGDRHRNHVPETPLPCSSPAGAMHYPYLGYCIVRKWERG